MLQTDEIGSEVHSTLTPLAQHVLDHYRHAPPRWGAEFEIESRSFTEELLRDTDPADLVASLVIPLPAITVEPHDPLGWEEERGYHQTLSDGLERLEKAPVADWRLSDQQIVAALVSYERMILADPHTGLQTRAFLAGVMRRAANGSPAARAALAAFIDRALQGHDDLDAWWAAKGREKQLTRDRLIADAGPCLGPALEHLLEYDNNLGPGCGPNDKPVQKLLGADALAKGKAFSHLLDLIVTSSGYDNLQALARRNGLFSHELPRRERPTPRIDMLAVEMVKGKMELADPDRDHARLIFLLTCREHHPNEIPKVTGRQILKRLLKTVQAHPGGQTAQALKKLIEHSRYLPWASDVREVLRDKVVRDDAGNAGSDPEPAASLPPIELPKFADMDELKAHFGNLLEPRLYDQAHSDYLEGRAKLSYAIEAVPRGDGRRREIRRLLRATGVKFEEDEDDELFADNELDCYVMSADHYRLLHELRGAFRPLVMGQPGAVAKLESLAHQIEKRPAPSAKWLSDARAVWDMLPQEAWLDHVRRGLERPAAAAPAALSAVPLLAGRHLADALSRSSADAHPCAQAGLVDRPTGWNKCCGDARRDGRVVARPRRPSVSTEGATVRLWHPMGADVAAVEAWRDRLEALQLTQPFAQVWREVYALTDAERDTATYTTRWAAHILKQHQAMTLARINGWRPTLRMWVDAPNDEPWHLVIPAHNLVADYWVQGAGGDDPQTLDSGAYVYVSTDRVQFHRIPEGATDSATGPRRGDPVPLIEIPPVIYSEIMRHADLFTAVASIAADPNWLDQGGNAEHPSQWGRHADDYWRETNTGTLVESGKRRRAMLERIVPRLRIADKLKLEDRYLVVQGTRHEYEIHLGSGACSRSGRHICIVPKSFAEGDKIWLPFEGDRTLSIILSKALLLAADDEITDPVILGQL